MKYTGKNITAIINTIILISIFFSSGSNFARSPAKKYTPGVVNNGGTITGMVTLTGNIPAQKELKVNKDKNVCGKHIPNQTLLVDSKSKGIQNVVVFIKNINSGKKWNLKETKFEIDQKGCVFNPHVVVLPKTHPLTVFNNDGILHNIHTHSEANAPINKAQPKFLKKINISFEESEFVKVTCDVHSWMQAWIAVAENPYYTVTDEKGKFELTDVPAGTYELEFWHEKLGKLSENIEVKSGAITKANNIFKFN